MKINNIIQIKNNQYKIEVEKGEPFLLFDETILKYNLMIGKLFTTDEITIIKEYNESMNSYYNMIKKINVKKRTEKEIKSLLLKDSLKNKYIDIIINKLKKSNYINDDLYIDSFINEQINLTLNGPYKIKKMLLDLGLSLENVELKLNSIDEEIWKNKINKIILKKSKSNRKYSSYELKRRIGEYLKINGYPSNFYNINIVVDVNDEDMYIKEYNKLEKKYSKKITDETLLKKKIDYELYKKGYKKNEI